MAPKLTPDNLTVPEGYIQDLDRNALDQDILPLVHHAGELELTPNSYSKKYTPAPPFPSPYTDPRIITDIGAGSQIDFLKKMKYDPTPGGSRIIEVKHYLGQSAPNRLSLEGVIRGTKNVISQAAPRQKDDIYPGKDVEILTLGTGSAIPNKYRNGISC